MLQNFSLKVDRYHNEVGQKKSTESTFKILTPEMVSLEMNQFVSDFEKKIGEPEFDTAWARVMLDEFDWNMHSLPIWFPIGAKTDILLHRIGLLRLKYMDPALCCVCYCEILPSDFLLSCHPEICFRCLKRHFKTKIQEGIIFLTCVQPNCDRPIDEKIVQKLVGKSKVWKLYQNLIQNAFVKNQPLMKWCPGAGCGNAVKIKDECALEVECTCGKQFCFSCLIDHEPISCKLLKRWEEIGPISEWMALNTKRCPSCKAPIEKNGGCDHMTCTAIGCNYEFCWICLGHRTSYNHVCKPPSTSVDATVDEKLLACFRKFQFHQTALKREEDFERNFKSQDKMIEGTQALVDSRRALMYSSALSFFMQDNAFSMEFEMYFEKLNFSTKSVWNCLQRKDPSQYSQTFICCKRDRESLIKSVRKISKLGFVKYV